MAEVYAFRQLVDIVVSDPSLNLRFGTVALVLARIYKNIANVNYPNRHTLETILEAQNIFKNDLIENKKINLLKATLEIQQKRIMKRLMKS